MTDDTPGDGFADDVPIDVTTEPKEQRADHADFADFAGEAEHAGDADYAGTAGSATHADFLDGYHAEALIEEALRRFRAEADAETERDDE